VKFSVGVQLLPQHTSMGDLRRAWKEADALGVDSMWVWDHFFPLSGDAEGSNFEGWTTLAAMAADTRRARLGTMVSSVGYRNADLLADMARTVDHIAGGRCYLGIGAGWAERDYNEYGYPFGTARSRLADLEAALPRIQARLERLNPLPAGRLPILIGGGGEKVTLRLVATYADAWNGFPPFDAFSRKMRVLDEWCEKVGRDPEEIERTVLLYGEHVEAVDDYVEAGASHVIVDLPHPFDLTRVEQLLKHARG
jgi:probable F420-dependent oxidoreductase